MVKEGIIDASKILEINAITGTKEADIEDLFDEAWYVALAKSSGIGVVKTKLTPGPRIVNRIEQQLGQPYNHYTPAAYLLREQATLLPGLDAATLDRFEELMKQINQRL